MFEKHPLFDLPAEDAVIWRYMDFTKYVSLLHKRELFFARGDRFEDPYEGSWSEPSKRDLELEYQDWLPDRDKNEINATLKEHHGFSNLLKCTVAINCWHINEHESAAMWRLYLKSNEGVAIRSTVANLHNSLKAEASSMALHIGKVRYIDFRAETVPVPPPRDNLIAPFIYKRKSFEHENELRVLTMLKETPTASSTNECFVRRSLPSAGIGIPVNLKKLIDNVFVAPTSPQWFRDLVLSISARYGIETRVTQSDLDRPLVW